MPSIKTTKVGSKVLRVCHPCISCVVLPNIIKRLELKEQPSEKDTNRKAASIYAG